MNGRCRVSLFVASWLLAGVAIVTPSLAENDFAPDARDVRLVNGKIHTLDGGNSIVSSVTIKEGKFASVGGNNGSPNGGPCMRVINLGGRTAVPGLVDNHNHFVCSVASGPRHAARDRGLDRRRPGSDRRGRKTVKPGEFITAMGGGYPVQFAENRLPTLAELDATAPNNPVLMFQAFTGPSATNTWARPSSPARASRSMRAGYIEAKADDRGPERAARDSDLRRQEAGTLDAMAYSASVGVTTNVDMGGFVIPGTSNVQDSAVFDALASWDPFTAYDPLLALHDEGKVSVRVRIFFLSMDTNPDVPLTSQRVLNAFSNFGDDMVRTSGIGEFATSWPLFGQSVPDQLRQRADDRGAARLGLPAAQPVAA